MRVLVCGGRDYKDWTKVYDTLTKLKKDNNIIHIINGGAEGADNASSGWAKDNSQPLTVFPAEWEIYGKPAGMIRNRSMLAMNPDLVISFPGGKGTANMVKLALETGTEVMQVI